MADKTEHKDGSGRLHERVRRDVFGWFDDPTQTTPSHDPGIENAVCPLCGKNLSRPVVTTSLMAVGDNRSYFYRSHKACSLAATDEDNASVESSLIDSVAPNVLVSRGDQETKPEN